ncbi:MAG: DUF302 domain-containing protein [Magnetococcales bacterium]|nr:DUF302 domain-containing protein [Magnetococcales bacterium]
MGWRVMKWRGCSSLVGVVVVLVAVFWMAQSLQAGENLPYPKSEVEKQIDGLPGVQHHGPVLQIPMPEGISFEDIEFSLESELAGQNLKLVMTQHLGRAIAARQGTPYPAYNIYHICNLTIGEKIISSEPAFGAFLPCKVVLYEEKPGGRVWAVTYKPAFALGYFPHIPEEVRKAAIEVGDRMYEILYRLATDG